MPTSVTPSGRTPTLPPTPTGGPPRIGNRSPPGTAVPLTVASTGAPTASATTAAPRRPRSCVPGAANATPATATTTIAATAANPAATPSTAPRTPGTLTPALGAP
jgi:hypothetical protein